MNIKIIIISLLVLLVGLTSFGAVSAEDPTITFETPLTNTVFSPNGDSVKDNTSFDVTADISSDWDINILNSAGTKILDLYSSTGVTNPKSQTWDGKMSTTEIAPDGVYTLSIKANEDGVPENETVITRTITVDTTAPTVTVTSPGTTVEATEATLIASANEESESWTYSLDNGAETAFISGVSKLSNLADGTNHTLIIYTVDGVGNKGNKTVDFSVDLPKTAALDGSTEISLEQSVDLNSATTANGTFKVKNTGQVDFTSVTFSIPDLALTYDNEQKIPASSVSITPSGEGLTVGEIKEYTVQVTVPKERDIDGFGHYTGTINIFGTASPEQEIGSFPLDVYVQPEGFDSKLQIIVDDVSDDKPYPGDNIDIDIKVKNKYSRLDMEDIRVSLDIIGMDVNLDDEKIDSLGSSDSETVTFNVDVPLDADEKSYILLVNVQADLIEDSETIEITGFSSFTGDLAVQRDKHDIVISDFKLSKSTANCGDVITANVDVANIGDNKEEDLMVKIKNSDLNINLAKSTGDLKKNKDETASFSLNVPRTVSAGVYSIDASVSYKDDSDQGDDNHLALSTSLTVECGASGGTGTPSGAITGILSGATTATVQEGRAAKYLLTINNNEAATFTYSLGITGISDWATSKAEPGTTVTVAAGQSAPVYIYLTPKAGIGPGTYTATVSVLSGTSTLESKTLTTTITNAGTDQTQFGRGILTGRAVGVGINTEVGIALGAITAVVIVMLVIAAFTIRRK